MRALLLLPLALWCFTTFTPRAFSQMIIAHRGASYEAPENTLVAFREAWHQQADGIEADFRLTADGEIVCIHDKDTKRTAGRFLEVARSALSELRELEYGRWKDARFAGEPIPILRQVLEAMPSDKFFVLELKTGPEIVRLVEEALEECDFSLDRLLIISFNQETVARCKERIPDARVHWLTGYEQDPHSGRWEPGIEEIARTLEQCQADGLGTQGNRVVVTKQWLEQLRNRGMEEFHVWTVDDPEDARYFRGLGPIAITTNRPAVIRSALQ